MLVGRVDGRRFYLRERWETYTVVVAPAGDPDIDPRRAAPDVPAVVVRSGSAGDLDAAGWVSHRRALLVIAEAVRTLLPGGPGRASGGAKLECAMVV